MNYWPIQTWPLNIFSSPGDSIKKQLIAAVDAQLKTILTTNGYLTNLGQNVKEWDVTPLDPALETFRLEYRDEEEGREDKTVGGQDVTLPLSLRIQTVGSTTLADIRKMMADVAAAMYADPTWGGLADDTNQDGQAKLDKAMAADTASGVEVKYKIEYGVARGGS